MEELKCHKSYDHQKHSFNHKSYGDLFLIKLNHKKKKEKIKKELLAQAHKQ